MKRGYVWGSLATSTAIVLLTAGCGGGGGGAPPADSTGVVTPAPTPSPSPTPTPTPSPPPAGATDPIIFAASGSQSFVTAGRYLRTIGGIDVTFDGVHYRVTHPANTTPQLLQRDPTFSPTPGAPWTNFVLADGLRLLVRASGAYTNSTFRYLYSNLAVWFHPDPNSNFSGTTAFGIPTVAGALPQQGSITYSGFLEGSSDEQYTSGGDRYFAGLQGTVSLTFDFAAGTAAITINPKLLLAAEHSLPPVDGARLDWASQAPHFRQSGSAIGNDSPISGQFVGPTGEELIGELKLEYISPIDGSRRSAGAAFIAKRTN